MTGGLVRDYSPEERELQQKLVELADLEAYLAERELEFVTFQAELQIFKHQYLQTVGTRLQKLQQLQAQVVEYRALLSEQALPSGELKQLYRQLAKAIHPDFAVEPEERERREALMAEVNRAYEREDIERLRALLKDWSSSPESVQGEDVMAELKRTQLKIAQSLQKLANVEQQIQSLEQTDERQLQRRAEQAKAAGRDHLAEKAYVLDQKIRAVQQQLDVLKSRSR